MKDPNSLDQPAYVWDCFYVPNAIRASENNDNGGVHENSSLLNLLSYKLYEAGMSVPEQTYFWINVALAMTPRTDFEQMEKIIPWCLERVGCSKYKDAAVKVMKEIGYSSKEIPTEIPKGKALVRSMLTDPYMGLTSEVIYGFYDVDTETVFNSWANEKNEMDVVLPADHTIVAAIFKINTMTQKAEGYVYSSDGKWVLTDLQKTKDIAEKYKDEYGFRLAGGEAKELAGFTVEQS